MVLEEKGIKEELVAAMKFVRAFPKKADIRNWYQLFSNIGNIEWVAFPVFDKAFL